MKPSLLPSLLLVMVLTSAFTLETLLFTVKIQGVENRDVLKDGVKPSELTQLTIDANDENIEIEEFEIILARGESPLERDIVRGNSYDLKKFLRTAKKGDRIVIKVNKVKGSKDNDLSDKNSILQILLK